MKNHMRLRLHSNIMLHATSFMQLVVLCKLAFRLGSFCQNQYTHLKMAMKHCTKFQVSLISHKEGEVSISYFILSTPLGSTITQRKVIESPCPIICTFVPMTMKHCTKSSRRRSEHQLFHTLHSYGSTKIPKNCWILSFCLYKHLLLIMKHHTKFQVSMISHLRGEVSTSYFKHPTPLGSTITKRKIIGSPLSWQYAHLLIIMKHLTKFHVSMISHLRGEVSTSYFTPSTPLWSTISHRKSIGSSSPDNMHIY
jgi:hypothetical protein